jgi:glycerate 2-kinase
MKIKNEREILSNLKLKKIGKDALKIISFGLNSINIKTKVKKNIPQTKKFKNIYVIGFGKSVNKMAQAVEEKLDKKITKGIIIGPKKIKLKKIDSFIGTHPYPSQKNISASKKIMELAKNATKDDLVICLISGGGSSMFEIPTIPLKKLKLLSKNLINSKKSIFEINNIRKKYSKVKGGKLAKAILPATCHTLIISDVVSNPIKIIASGPTAIKSKKVYNKIIIKNLSVLNFMQKKAKNLGYNTKIISDSIKGKQKNAIKKIFVSQTKKTLAIISGGETTLEVKGCGKGGRNQEFVIKTLNILPKNSVFLSINSDGIDGNSNAAGAIIDSFTFQGLLKNKINYEKFIKNNDSNGLFKKIGLEIITGETEINLMDIQLCLIKKE